MATLTLTVSDEMAQTIAALPEEDRAAYLADVNAFATAQLQKYLFSTAFNGRGNGNGQAQEDEPTYHILDLSEDTTPFTEADGEALREAFADFDAGKRGKPAAESFALIAARLGFKNQTL